jgi:hypothetical protein
MRIEQLVFTGVTQRVLEITLADFLGRPAWSKRIADILLDASQQGAQNVFTVAKAAVNGGSVSPRRLGHGSHGESFFRSLFPQLLGGV